MSNEEIGYTIRRLREQAGVQAKDLAVALNLDASAISNIENGKRAVKTGELADIARKLGISPLAILEPDSLLARLPVAARSTTFALDESVRDRLTALAELNHLLSESGVRAMRQDTAPPKMESANWFAASRQLATWASAKIQFGNDGGRFESLAKCMEDQFGIDVLVEDCADGEALGAAITDPEFPFVFVNARQIRSRALFTLAHELGHVLAREGATLTVEHDLSGTSTGERLANAFASELLMPQVEIENVSSELGKNASALGKMMRRFEVSYESMIYRLHNLQLINVEGRNEFLAIGFSGLLAELEDPEDRAALLELRVTLDRKRPPRMLVERLLRGYNLGVVSIRPLAEMLQQDPDDLISLLSSSGEGSFDFAGLLSKTIDSATSQDDRFAGRPV